MKTARHALLAALLLTACKSTPETKATSASAITEPPSSPAASLASARQQPSAAPSSSEAPSASGAPTAASPCPEGARKNDDARYCITLPEKRLAVSYEGDSPDQGIREELEIGGDRVVITVGPAPRGKAAASLKKGALERLGSSVVESGDLPNGYWTDAKNEGGGHIIQGVVVSKYVISCTYWVSDEERVEAAREVCKSLRTF